MTVSGDVVRQPEKPLPLEHSREWTALAADMPKAAVAAAWAELSDDVRQTVHTAGEVWNDDELRRPTATTSVLTMAEQLEANELIAPDALRAIERLAVLRNRARHAAESEIKPSGALSFVEAVRDLQTVLRRARFEVFLNKPKDEEGQSE